MKTTRKIQVVMTVLLALGLGAPMVAGAAGWTPAGHSYHDDRDRHDYDRRYDRRYERKYDRHRHDERYCRIPAHRHRYVERGYYRPYVYGYRPAYPSTRYYDRDYDRGYGNFSYGITLHYDFYN